MSNKFQVVKKIGEGEHGSVFLVQRVYKVQNSKNKSNSSSEQQLYAMKKIPVSKNYFDFQANLLLSLNHPNVIKVQQVFQDKQFLTLILQLAEQGDLHQYIKRNFFRKVPEATVASWLCQLSLGLYYLHNENNIIHRDIKSRNILVKQNGILKFADFGVARKLQKGQDFAKTSVGTPCYLSPQSINLGKYDNKSDVWSLGCLMYEICTGQKPFQGQSLGSLLNNIVNNQFGQIPEKYSLWLRQLIGSMLQKDPQKRPSIVALLQNSHIKKEYKYLRQMYPQYLKIIYPEQGPKTTKYLDIDDRKLNSLKIFSQCLKTTKNERSIKLQIEEKHSGSEQSSQNKNKSQKQKSFIKNDCLITSKNINENPKNKYQRNHVNSVVEFKGSQLINFQKNENRNQPNIINNVSSSSGSLNKLEKTFGMPNIGSRKVERDKFIDKSLKSIIANRAKDKTQKKSNIKK